jgi:hypothetical protein
MSVPEGERKWHPMETMCHAMWAGDSHAVTQRDTSPVAGGPSLADGKDSQVVSNMALQGQNGESPATAVTTMMVSCLPTNMKPESFIESLHENGFANTYNLLYIPMSPKKSRKQFNNMENLGYIFVNFKEAENAEAFAEVFASLSFSYSPSKKLARIKPARCQGFEANIEMHTSIGSNGRLGIVDDNGQINWKCSQC